jgi:uncharacterized repeat protein (TIGR03803 family)
LIFRISRLWQANGSIAACIRLRLVTNNALKGANKMNPKTQKKLIMKTVSAATVLLLSLTLTAGAGYRVLHQFSGDTNDGAWSYGAVTLSGSTLYGMSSWGGNYNNGAVFKINTDSTGFQLLHSFVSPAGDGQYPYGSLLLSGSMLYGMTSCDQSIYGGTIFKINTDGNDFQVLHSFTGGSNDGKYPYDSLLQSGSVFYGMTCYGGTNDLGTVFRINADGTGFQVLHSFAGGESDGAYPWGSLALSGSTLYGTTYNGGENDSGVVFQINTDGNGFQLLHSFNGSDGLNPFCTLIQSGSTLYGTTNGGGANGNGAIFKIDTDGSDFQILHSFGGNDGLNPAGSLTLSGSILYGATYGGGANNNGTVFKIDTDGNNFLVLHSISEPNGNSPNGSLLLSGLTLYGTTNAGGSENLGVVFAIDMPICLQQPEADFNGDCKVDFEDFAVFAAGWLDCGLEPSWACYQN